MARALALERTTKNQELGTKSRGFGPLSEAPKALTPRLGLDMVHFICSFEVYKGGGDVTVTVIEQLLKVQEHDSQIRALEQELKDVPRRKEEETSRLEAHKEALKAAEEKLQGAQSEVKQFEIEADSRRDKIAKLRSQQIELKTNKEFKAMDVEIKGAEDEIRKIEDNELVAIERVEGVRAEVDEKRSALKQEEEEVSTDVRLLDERMAAIEAELTSVRDQRKLSIEGIDGEFLGRYEVIISRMYPAVVPVAGEVCGGCHMKLPPYLIHNSKKPAEMVVCDYCARLLYNNQ